MPRAVVTGGAGFLGSHLCRSLVTDGWDVVAVDNLLTGRAENVADLAVAAVSAGGTFSLAERDVARGLQDPAVVALARGGLDAVLHFASAASPPEYLAHPIETLEVGSRGTQHALDLARETGARFLLASTSEVYGDPTVHPQRETYWGNVNPVGPRSVYDEAKRFAEAIATAYARVHDVDVKLARIFNTYGPGLRPGDGRVVSNFVAQALEGRPLTIYGDGSQTRSFCYVDDEVRGLLALLHSSHRGPMNIGNPQEYTVLELAELVLEVTGSSSELTFAPLPVDDPVRRCPDISLARSVLDWQPEVPLAEGLRRTADEYARARAG
jgi:dTDP-glucose 4,6-dehydratase